MFVADQPAAVAPAQQPGLIEVVGTRRDRAQKIDRRIYKVRQSPQSAQADLMQLLRGLPAVIVKADGQILLLGSDKVSIMVDEKSGQSVPLAALRGSDIDPIEIITNPSAQFSPQGTGGIINIVLRRKQDDGASGSAAAELSSSGRGKANGSITRKRGAWTYQLDASDGSGRLSRSTYRKVRTVEFDGGGTASNSEDGGGSSSMTDGSLSGRLAYEFDSKTGYPRRYLAGPATRVRATTPASIASPAISCPFPSASGRAAQPPSSVPSSISTAAARQTARRSKRVPGCSATLATAKP